MSEPGASDFLPAGREESRNPKAWSFDVLRKSVEEMKLDIPEQYSSNNNFWQNFYFTYRDNEETMRDVFPDDKSKKRELLGKIATKGAIRLTAEQENSGRDFLTKLFNRKILQERMAQFQSRITKDPDDDLLLVTVMMDLDHFKDVNDTYGHEGGDEALRDFAKKLQENIRATEDMAFRYGGEEFTLLMLMSRKALLESVKKSDDLLATISKRVEIIRQKIVSQLGVTLENGSVVKTTSSAGIAVADKSKSVVDALKEADEYLYKAKEAGRNCAFTEEGKVVL